MDTVWATVKVRRSVLAEASAMMPGMSNAAIVQRALESVLTGPGDAPEIPDGGSAAPSRASADEEAVEQAGARKASQRSPAPARRRSKVPAGPQASPPSDVSSSASQGREVEAGVNGGAGAALRGQTTVEEMLASCPNCAGEMQDFCLDDGKGGGEMTKRCEDCGYVREPS
jgi:hypothetical protein